MPRPPCRLRRGAEGEKASLAHEEAVRRQTQGDMVIEAAPAAALELGQADLLLEFAIVLLDPVAALDVPDEVLEGLGQFPRRRGGGWVRQIALTSFLPGAVVIDFPDDLCAAA